MAKQKHRKNKSGSKIKIKALGLFSGGLDSLVAAKMMKDLGFEIELLHFTSPFCNCDKRCVSGKSPADMARQLGLPLANLPKGLDYIDVIRNAKHGYGTGMNPCMDCRIYTFKKAKEYMKKTGAAFIFTGEVLSSRPMSQVRQALEIIDRESGLQGKIVRPLSAKLLPATEAEAKGLYKRSKMLSISGRSRKTQIQLAKKWHLSYPSPAGGCMLAEKYYGICLRDLFKHKPSVDWGDIAVLSAGRQFRFGKSKIIVGRKEIENIRLRQLKKEKDILFECEDPILGPVTLLQGPNSPKSIMLAARLTAYFSDARKERIKKVKVNCWKEWNGKTSRPYKQIIVSPNLDIEKETKKGLKWIGQAKS